MTNQPLNLLVVEDDVSNRRVFEAMLTLAGHTVTMAVDGEEALAAISGVRYDMVLLDLMLPGIDGFEFCRRLRARPDYAHVPVLAVSALVSPKDEREALRAGCDGYLRKPFRNVELGAAMDDALARCSGQKLHQARREALITLRAEARAALATAADARELLEVCVAQIASCMPGASAGVWLAQPAGAPFVAGPCAGPAPRLVPPAPVTAPAWNAALSGGRWEAQLPLGAAGAPADQLSVVSPRALLEDELDALVAVAETLALGLASRRANEALDTLYRALTHAAEGIARIDMSGRYVYVNDAFARMVGYAPDELVGMHWQRVVHPDDHARVLDATAEMARTGRVELEMLGVDKQGRTFHQHTITVPATDGGGRLCGLFCFSKDITARKRDEAELLRRGEALERLNAELVSTNERVEAEVVARTQELRETNEKLRAQAEELTRQRNFMAKLMEHLPGGVAVVDAGLNFKMVNPIYAQKFGMAAEHFVGRHVYEMFPQAREQVGALFDQALAGTPCSAYSFPFRYPAAEGAAEQTTYFDISYHPLPEGTDGAGGVLVLCFEVSERVRLEQEVIRHTEELERKQALLSTLMDHVPASIAFVDQDMVFRLVNPAHTRLHGKPLEAFVDRRVTDVFPEAAERTVPLLQRVLTNGEPIHAEGVPFTYERDGKRHTTFWDFVYCPVFSGGSEPAGVLGLGVEVSARVENERLQREQVKALERASAIKDEFVAVVSHELRTPLTAIKNAASIIASGKAGALTPAQARFAELLTTHTRRLTELVDDLLDVQRLECGGLAFELADADLGRLARETAESFEDVLRSRRLELALDAPESVVFAHVDRRRIAQVLLNLLSNAAKFTPEGGRISVRVWHRNGEACLAVSDTGIGIAPQHMPLLFEKFVQVESSLNRLNGGTGLGLAICRRLVEEGHGGRIWCESQPGQGSTFVVALPTALRALSGEAACGAPCESGDA